MCLSLCACGGGASSEVTTKSDEIELTLDNYDDYLNIRPYVSPGADRPCNNDSFFDMNGKRCGASSISSYLSVVAEVEGVSQNYTYSDIVIEVRATGKHILCNPNDTDDHRTMYSNVVNADFTQSITCNLNVSGTGKGESSEKYTFSGNSIMPWMLFADCYEFSCEIVSISGKVTPLK